MGKGDIRASVSAHGGHTRLHHFAVGANTSRDTIETSWKEGELLFINVAVGDIDLEGTAGATAVGPLVKVAATSSEGLINLLGGPSATTGAADGQLCGVYATTDDLEYSTRNAFDNTNTNIGPAGSNTMAGIFAGVTCAWWRQTVANGGTVSGDVNGDFGIDINAAGMTITRIVDATGQDTSITGAAADRIFFTES